MKKVCCECGKKKPAYKSVVQHVDGKIDYICRVCWEKLDYFDFMQDLG